MLLAMSERRPSRKPLQVAVTVLEPLLAVLLIATEAYAAWLHRTPLGLCAGSLAAAGAALSRRLPAWGLGVTLAGTFLLSLLPPSTVGLALLMPAVSVLTLTFRGRHSLALWATGGGIACGLIGSRRAASLTEWLGATTVWVVAYATAWLIAVAMARLRDEQAQTLRDGLEHQRRLIASELHDNVANELAMLVMRAEAARTRTPTSDELLAIAESGRKANQYLRHLMELLRLDGEFRPLSLETELHEAAVFLRKAHMSPSCEVQGDVSLIPPAPADTLARVTREATTNMARHAPAGSHCAILIRVSSDTVEALFTNPWAGTTGQGLGIPGMRERIKALGGSFFAGVDDDLWVVRVSIPFTSQPRMWNTNPVRPDTPAR